jgi:hypothetical protein
MITEQVEDSESVSSSFDAEAVTDTAQVTLTEL